MSDQDFQTQILVALENIQTNMPHLATREEVGKVKGLTELNKQTIENNDSKASSSFKTHKWLIGIMLIGYLPLIGLLLSLHQKG